MILLDLNGFKQINDTYGHGTGDEALLIVAERLLRAVREGDLVARFGGDEFIVLAEHLLGPEAAASVALRIIQGLTEPIMTGKVRHQFGAGIGIALLPENADTAAEALRMADLALIGQKPNGARLSGSSKRRWTASRASGSKWSEIRQALDSGLIQVRFRPSIDLGTGKVIGFEAVPAWVAENGDEIPPERFLPTRRKPVSFTRSPHACWSWRAPPHVNGPRALPCRSMYCPPSSRIVPLEKTSSGRSEWRRSRHRALLSRSPRT